METINDFAVITYFAIGTIFIFFAVFVMTFGNLHNPLKLSISGLFLATGFYFFNSAGKILTEYDIGFMKLSLINSCIIAVIASVLVFVVYRLNKEKGEHND